MRCPDPPAPIVCVLSGPTPDRQKARVSVPRVSNRINYALRQKGTPSLQSCSAAAAAAAAAASELPRNAYRAGQKMIKKPKTAVVVASVAVKVVIMNHSGVGRWTLFR